METPHIEETNSKNKQRLKKAVKGNSVYFFYLYQNFISKIKITKLMNCHSGSLFVENHKYMSPRGKRNKEALSNRRNSLIEIKIQNSKEKESGPTVLSRLWSL
jgi:hypothetical protein